MSLDGERSIDQLLADAEHWRRHGWVLMDQLLPKGATATALAELLAVTPDQLRRSGPVRRADAAVDGKPSFRDEQFDGTTLFPYPGAPTLNRLFVHPNLVRFAAAVLSTDDLRLYQARVWSKYGRHTDYDQPLHRDRNHSLIPMVNGEPWGHVEYFVFLHDVDESNGAPMVVPHSASADPIWPNAPDGGTEDDAAARSRTEVRAVCRAGSVLAYRSDVWHRGRDLDPQQERHILVASYRPAAAEWIGFDAPAPLAGRPDFQRFVAESTPGELALLGIPPPHHPVWTAAMVDALGAMYPGLDISPWRPR